MCYAKHMKQKGFAQIFLIIIIIVFGIGAIGYLAYQNSQINNTKVDIKQSDNSVQKPIQNINKNVESDNWLTYKNTKYGYTFRYPSELKINSYDQIKEEAEIINFAKEKNNYQTQITINVSNSKTDKDLYTDYKNRADGKSVTGKLTEEGSEMTAKISEIQIDKNTAYESTVESDTDILRNILVEKNDLIFGLQFLTNDKNDKSIFDKILATFKFL